MGSDMTQIRVTEAQRDFLNTLKNPGDSYSDILREYFGISKEAAIYANSTVAREIDAETDSVPEIIDKMQRKEPDDDGFLYSVEERGGIVVIPQREKEE